MYKNKRSIEIGIILLFIITTIFINFIVWSHFYFFNEEKAINKSNFYKLLYVSAFRALIVDVGFIAMYYYGKKRGDESKIEK